MSCSFNLVITQRLPKYNLALKINLLGNKNAIVSK